MALLPNFRGRLPRPGGARSSITRDPAAEAYYSNDPARVEAAVQQGYARGGPVRTGYDYGGPVDPMDYVPDRLPPREQPPPPRPQYDPYNTIGREEPKASPIMAYAPDTGYAEGGPIKRLKNWQDVGVAQAMEDALYEQPGYTSDTGYGSSDAASAGLPAGYGGYAEGGEVSQQAAPDIAGYVRGDNALPPEQLDAILQQIAQLDPSKDEDAVNLTAIVQAAQSGDMDHAASILAGFRKRFDRLNAHAQGAAAHGDLNAAAALAGKAHSQVPDGMTVSYVVAPDGTGVTATVSPSGQTFQMSGPQFHDYLVGPGTSFDHILENGLEKNLSIASGGQQQAQTGYAGGSEEQAEPADMTESAEPEGYAAGGAVNRDPTPGRRALIGYAEGGEVTDEEQQRQEAERAAAEAAKQEQQAVRDTLQHTRQSYNLVEPVGGRTALSRGIGFPASWGPQPPTRAQAEAESVEQDYAPPAPATGGLGRGAPTGAPVKTFRTPREALGTAEVSETSVPEMSASEREALGLPRERPETPATVDTSGVTADEAQRTAGPRTTGARTAEPQRQPDKPPITEQEWQDYLERQTGYVKEDPNDPWTKRAGVLPEAQTAPVDRRITNRPLLDIGKYGRNEGGEAVYDQRTGQTSYVGGQTYDREGRPLSVRPYNTREVPTTYTGSQGEERTGPNTAVTSVRNSNGDIVPALPSGRPSSDPQPGQTYDRDGRPIAVRPPTAAQLKDTAERERQAENRRSTDAIYTGQGVAGPYGSSPRPEAVAARETADRRSAQQSQQPPDPLGRIGQFAPPVAPVNPAYAEEPFAGTSAPVGGGGPGGRGVAPSLPAGTGVPGYAPAPLPARPTNQELFDTAKERGDIYTTPAWSMARAREGLSDIAQGKFFGRKNTVDYSQAEAPATPAAARPPLGPVTPEENEQRRAGAFSERQAELNRQRELGANIATQGEPRPPNIQPLLPPQVIRDRNGTREIANPRNIEIQQNNQREQHRYELEMRQRQTASPTKDIAAQNAADTHMLNAYNHQRTAMLKYMADNGVTDTNKVPEAYRVHPQLEAMAQDYYRRRAPAGGGGQPQPQAQQGGGRPVQVSSPEDVRKLPSGTKFVIPDGSGRIGTVP